MTSSHCTPLSHVREICSDTLFPDSGFSMKNTFNCGMYIPLSDDKHQFVQKVHSARANGHWDCGHNSNPVATLPHAAVVFRMQPF